MKGFKPYLRKMSFKIPDVVKLSRKAWRAGRYSNSVKKTSSGKGMPQLLNDEGHSCIMGQVALQSGVAPERIRCHGLTMANVVLIPNEGKALDLSMQAMRANDCTTSTLSSKITALKEVFRSHGHELEVTR